MTLLTCWVNPPPPNATWQLPGDDEPRSDDGAGEARLPTWEDCVRLAWAYLADFQNYILPLSERASMAQAAGWLAEEIRAKERQDAKTFSKVRDQLARAVS